MIPGLPAPRKDSQEGQEGSLAFKRGSNPWDNPYKFGTQEHEDWRSGYNHEMMLSLTRGQR